MMSFQQFLGSWSVEKSPARANREIPTKNSAARGVIPSYSSYLPNKGRSGIIGNRTDRARRGTVAEQIFWAAPILGRSSCVDCSGLIAQDSDFLGWEIYRVGAGDDPRNSAAAGGVQRECL
jgi:hypothetical protein